MMQEVLESLESACNDGDVPYDFDIDWKTEFYIEEDYQEKGMIRTSDIDIVVNGKAACIRIGYWLVGIDDEWEVPTISGDITVDCIIDDYDGVVAEVWKAIKP